MAARVGLLEEVEEAGNSLRALVRLLTVAVYQNRTERISKHNMHKRRDSRVIYLAHNARNTKASFEF